MSGVVVTTGRAARMLFSQSYLDETLGLVVRDGDREAFSTWAAIRARPATTIAVPDVPYYIAKIRQSAPKRADPGSSLTPSRSRRPPCRPTRSR